MRLTGTTFTAGDCHKLLMNAIACLRLPGVEKHLQALTAQNHWSVGAIAAATTAATLVQPQCGVHHRHQAEQSKPLYRQTLWATLILSLWRTVEVVVVLMR